MTTLSEAIKQCLDKADREERKADTFGEDDFGKISDCMYNAREHRQLAGWLKELEDRRRVMSQSAG